MRRRIGGVASGRLRKRFCEKMLTGFSMCGKKSKIGLGRTAISRVRAWLRRNPRNEEFIHEAAVTGAERAD